MIYVFSNDKTSIKDIFGIRYVDTVYGFENEEDAYIYLDINEKSYEVTEEWMKKNNFKESNYYAGASFYDGLVNAQKTFIKY